MAKLLDLTASERPIARSPGSAQMSTSVPGQQGESQGLQSLGTDLQQGAEQLFAAQKVEEERVNTLRAEEAYTRVLERKMDLSLGDNGFTRVRGSEAVSRPIFKEWTKRFEDAQKEIEGGLSNDTQRLKFRQRADVARQHYQEEILRHLAREGDVYAKEVYEGTLVQAQRDAVVRWDSPNDIGASLTRIEAAIDERSERYGWPKEYRDATLKIEAGKVHAAVVQQALAQGQFKYAEEWYKAHREDVDLATAKQLERAVEDGTQKELQATYNATYLADENNPTALEALRKKALADPGLDENRRNVIVGRIQNRQYVLEQRAVQVENRRVTRIARQLADLNASTLAGFEPSADQFQPLLNEARGTDLEPEVKQAIGLANATRQFRNTSPLVQERLLLEAEAGLRTEPNKFDRRVVSAWRSIYDAQRKQVHDSPVAFALRQGVYEQRQPLDLSEPGRAGPALAERFSVARGVAQAYNAPFKPLMEEEVAVMRATLAGAPVEAKRNYFAALFNASEGDLAGYMGIMAQLAPDDPVTAIAGSHAARGRGPTADLMLRGQQILTPSKKSDGKPDGGGLYPMPPDTDLRSRFDSHVREAFAGKAETRNAHFQAAKAIYAALAVDEGDRDTKVMNKDRWDRAIEAAIGPIAKYPGIGGRRVVLPHGYEADQFKDGLYQRINRLVEQKALDPSWTASRLRDLPVQNIGDGRYVFRVGDGVLVGPRNLGTRADGTPKGAGFLGMVRRPDGGVSTEISVGVEIDGREMEIPTMVPTLTREEVDTLLKTPLPGGEIPESIMRKAEAHARARLAAGKPVFATAQESPPPQDPVVIDFNQSLPYVPSGERAGIRPMNEGEPSAEELAAAARPVTGRALPRADRK